MRVRGITVAVVLLLVALTPRVVASGPTLPANDPFYRYTGSTPLRKIPPGTVLKHRTVQLALAPGMATPVDAEQLLYRTTGQRGEPTVTVTTVLVPTPVRVPAPAPANIVEYLSFYDGLGSQCDPSYTLAGGDTGDAISQQQAQEETLLVSWYLSQGDIVTVPDFEGTGLHWMAGRESGYAALDAIKATQSYLRLDPTTTKAGLSGYSGGSVAANWASELAPAYAPTVNIVGVAEGGIPANYLNHLAYIDGTDEYSAAIPGELLGLSRAYAIDLAKYLSPYGRKVVDEISNVCIASAFGRYPGLTIRSIMRPEYADLAHAEPFATILRAQTMGTARTHPRAPLFMAIGNADGTGDGAMVAADVKALARRYCAQGAPVQYQEYPGASHIEAAALSEPQTGPFLQQRFAGLPFASDCGSL